MALLRVGAEVRSRFFCRGIDSSFSFLPCPGHCWVLHVWIDQVFVLALTFLILFLGNFLTTLKVVHAKLQKNRNKTKQP